MKKNKYEFDLQHIDISAIEANPANPRGINVRDKDEQFQYLKRSIEEFGLIVPIIVQEISSEPSKKYRLLDGERRYWALKELGYTKVKANVIKNRITARTAKNVMFHIHTNRLQWDACQQCRALEPVYGMLKKIHKRNEEEIIRQLILMTGTNKRTVQSRLNFLRWPKSIKNYVYFHDPEKYWTVVEIEDGFIKPAEENFPQYFRRVKKNEVRRLLFEKYLKGDVYKSTDVRKINFIVKVPRDNKEQYAESSIIIRKLIEDTNFTFDDARDDFLAKFPEAEQAFEISFKKVRNQILKTTSVLSNLQANLFSKKERKEIDSFIDELEVAIDGFRKSNE